MAWDHAETGVLTAQWVAKYVKENLDGKVRVGVLAMLNAVHTQVRSEAFKKTLIELLGEENITWVFDQDFRRDPRVCCQHRDQQHRQAH